MPSNRNILRTVYSEITRGISPGGRDLRSVVFYLFFISWIFSAAAYLGRAIGADWDYLRTASRCSLKELRAWNAYTDARYSDYDPILAYCDRIMPAGEKLRLVLPQDPTIQHQRLREKGRYFLYPRNFGNNDLPANFILVYGVRGFSPPAGYAVGKIFGRETYLLVRSKGTTAGGADGRR